MSHPFDRRVAIEALRKVLALLEAPVFQDTTVKMLGPKSRSDDDLWEHFSTNIMSSWHMCSTVKMGKNAEEACVDTAFKVFGIDNLRVVDLSILPMLPK